MFFVFQKFQTMLFDGYQKTTNIAGYFFKTLEFQEKYFIGNENPAKTAFCEKISALQKFLPQMNILLSLSRK